MLADCASWTVAAGNAGASYTASRPPGPSSRISLAGTLWAISFELPEWHKESRAGPSTWACLVLCLLLFPYMEPMCFLQCWTSFELCLLLSPRCMCFMMSNAVRTPIKVSPFWLHAWGLYLALMQ